MLRQLKYLYENERERMDEDMINMYFWLLCVIDLDCQGPDPLKFEWHHIIPQERIFHPLVVAALQCSDKFLFNGEDNLISLEKYVKETGNGRHGNHPKYNEWVQLLLNLRQDLYEEEHGFGPIDPCKAKDIIIDLIKNTLTPSIMENTNEKIDDLGKRKLKI